MLNKKVKGEGLKTLFIKNKKKKKKGKIRKHYIKMNAWIKEKRVKSKSTLGSKIEKALKRI